MVWGQPALLSSTTLLYPFYSAQMRLLGLVRQTVSSVFGGEEKCALTARGELTYIEKAGPLGPD